MSKDLQKILMLGVATGLLVSLMVSMTIIGHRLSKEHVTQAEEDNHKTFMMVQEIAFNAGVTCAYCEELRAQYPAKYKLEECDKYKDFKTWSNLTAIEKVKP